MKKSIKFITIALALLLTLTACGGGTGDTDKDEKVTITFSYWDNFDEAIFERFNELYPDINVEFVVYPDGEYSQKINTMLVGGTAPDVITAFEADLPRFAKEGLIVDLENYIAESDKIVEDDFMPAVDQLNDIVDGKFGLPWSYAGEIMYYNKDMFDAAGIDYPTADWTWETYADAAKELTIRDGDETEVWGSDAINFRGIWYSMIGAYGDAVVDGDQLALGDGVKKALEIEDRMTNEDKSVPSLEAGGSIADLFEAGKAAMTRTGTWMTALYSDVDFNWGIAPLPQGTREYTTLHTGFYVINDASEHKEEAWNFIEFLMSEEGQSMITKFSANPSSIQSYEAKKEFEFEGLNGPGSWAAFDSVAENGEFGYVLLNASVTSEIVDQFEAYVLGEATMEQVIEAIEKGNKDLANQ